MSETNKTKQNKSKARMPSVYDEWRKTLPLYKELRVINAKWKDKTWKSHFFFHPKLEKRKEKRNG